MSDEAVLYWCDPEKNTECRKMSCRHVLTLAEGGVCEATFNPAFALLDENGKPMIYEKHVDRKRRQKAWDENCARAHPAGVNTIIYIGKESEERKNVSGVNQQSDVYVQRDLQGEGPGEGQ